MQCCSVLERLLFLVFQGNFLHQERRPAFKARTRAMASDGKSKVAREGCNLPQVRHHLQEKEACRKHIVLTSS